MPGRKIADLSPEDQEIVADVSCKWYLNGFPKSGLHLAVRMILPLAKIMPVGQMRVKSWNGTFDNHSWGTNYNMLPRMCYRLSELKPGYFYKAHCGWLHDLEAFMWMLGVAHVFIYRDFRDVAVSQTYHILNEDDTTWLHPGREKFYALGSKDEILKAVIVGLDEYPGVMDRWEFYAPWLDVDWVFKFRFEEAIADLPRMADRLVCYGLDRLGQIFEVRFYDSDTAEVVGHMVESAKRTDKSPTFRRGQTGDWHFEFNDEHKKLFKETDKNNWLIRLGYESSSDW